MKGWLICQRKFSRGRDKGILFDKALTRRVNRTTLSDKIGENTNDRQCKAGFLKIKSLIYWLFKLYRFKNLYFCAYLLTC